MTANKVANDDGNKATGSTPSLPAELLARIVAELIPPVDRNASTYPPPHGDDLDDIPWLPSSSSSDILSVASSSTLLKHLADRALYRSPLLRTLKSLNLLASILTADAKKHASSTEDVPKDRNNRADWMRSIQLPPGDGLLQPGDTLADQTSYVDSLRIIFNHAARLDYVSLEHRQAGAALLEFLHPRTSCRPRRITISNLSFSAPPFSTTKSLAPLSKVTHLHLIKIVPPPALISFLVGEQINLEEQGNVPNSIKAGLSPRETLECLRLSLLPPDALVDFAAYIAWRMAWKEYERLPSQRQAQEPAPRAPRGPARRFAVQEALYDLATHSSNLPRLRLLLLELSPLGPLPSPMEEERQNDPFAAFLRARGVAPPPTNGMPFPTSGASRTHTATHNPLPSDVRAKLSDASRFQDAILTAHAAAQRATEAVTSTFGPTTYHILTGGDEDGDDDDSNDGSNHDEEDDEDMGMATGEDLRIGERDKYWRLVEAGKTALVQLWIASSEQASQEVSHASVENGSPDIRVVAARPNGHDRREGFQDFYCQSQNSASTVNSDHPRKDASDFSSEFDAADPQSHGRRHRWDEVGSFADPDVFSLVTAAPHLSFKSVGGTEQGWFWTGELPRETNVPSTRVLPSRIAAF